MSGMKEIRTHIKSVQATLKITNAMYLISSATLRKAKRRLTDVTPYFNKLSYTISDILHRSPTLTHPFFDRRPQKPPEDRRIAYLVISGDKGLAGAYNHNVLKLADGQIHQASQSVFYLIGQRGRNWFSNKNATINHEFSYSAQNPTMTQARAMSLPLLDDFLSENLDEIWVIYTHMIHPLLLEPKLVKLLPLNPDIFPWTPPADEAYPRTVSYYPSESVVLDHLVPDYFAGMLFGTLVESFSSEQSSRMTAMDAATKNAKEILRGLQLTYNRARQSAITQELTEVVGGAKANLD